MTPEAELARPWPERPGAEGAKSGKQRSGEAGGRARQLSRRRWNPRRGLPAAALVGIAAVVLGACAGQDADRDDVINAVEEAQGPDDEMPADYPECVADGFFETFEQDEINDLANAQTVEDFPEENDVGTDAVQIMQTCWDSDGQSFEVESESTESTDSTDTTASTESSESTTSTTATE